MDPCFIRTGPAKTYKDIATAHSGDRLSWRGVSENGWHGVDYKGRQAWVSGRYGKLVV